MPKGADKTNFYRHDQNWTNRMILVDSLQVMPSLTEREGLRGNVQCILFRSAAWDHLQPDFSMDYDEMERQVRTAR